MQKFIIQGGTPLVGELEIEPSKNAILPILASTILLDGTVNIKKCPKYTDVLNMLEILKRMGAKVVPVNQGVNINCTYNSTIVPKELSKLMRSSIMLLGPILAKFKTAEVVYPGGCNIGSRPIDIHLKGLKELGVEIIESNGVIYCNGENMHPATLNLSFPSVGATENLIMASVFLKGTTIISNIAIEPEVMDLINFLNQSGAKIKVTGTVAEIEGVENLKTDSYNVISDRIVLGTLMLATAITRGKATFINAQPINVAKLTNILKKSGCKIDATNDKITIDATKNKFLSIGFVETQVYPGFATDLQAQTLTYATILNGTSVFLENIFESRYKHVAELNKMGANILIKDRWAVIEGVKKLQGAEVDATDLRGGAALVLAGLSCCGTTIVNNVEHIDRGYYKFEEMLSSLGANIKRV